MDLTSIEGHVYDVDFFLSGDPENMAITEISIHKTNGKPLYDWKQRDDKTWYRLPSDKATPDLRGVVKEWDRFDFFYRATMPKVNDVGGIS